MRVVGQVAVKVKTDKLTPQSLAGFSMVVMVDAALEDYIEYGCPFFLAHLLPCLGLSRSDFGTRYCRPALASPL